jgi:hypothetical protein
VLAGQQAPLLQHQGCCEHLVQQQPTAWGSIVQAPAVVQGCSALMHVLQVPKTLARCPWVGMLGYIIAGVIRPQHVYHYTSTPAHPLFPTLCTDATTHPAQLMLPVQGHALYHSCRFQRLHDWL